MERREDNSGVVVAIGLALILLLLAGGGAGVYYVVSRQQMALAMQNERDLLAEAQARMEVERAHAEAAAASRTTSKDKEQGSDQSDSTRSAVESILRAQEAAWNRGDLDAFMEHYWQDDALTFSSEGKTTRGWTATLTRYRERYPTPKEMGSLKLSELEITPLGSSAALVLGRWNVQREGGPLSGNFSLVVRKFDDRWLIVHDHTSRLKD